MSVQLSSLPLRQQTDILLALEPALDMAGQTHSLRDLWEALENGQCQLWLHDGSAAVTEIIVSPKLRTLHIWLAGGTLEPLVEHVLPDIEEYAETMNCDRITISGRRGWERALVDRGYGSRISLLTKELH